MNCKTEAKIGDLVRIFDKYTEKKTKDVSPKVSFYDSEFYIEAETKGRYILKLSLFDEMYIDSTGNLIDVYDGFITLCEEDGAMLIDQLILEIQKELEENEKG